MHYWNQNSTFKWNIVMLTVALLQIRNADWIIIDIWRMFTCKVQTVGRLTYMT